MIYTLEQQAQNQANVIPIFWARLSVNHTKKTYFFFLSIPLLAIVLIILTKSFTLDGPDTSDYLLRNDHRSELYDARRAALDQFKYISSQNLSHERMSEAAQYSFSLILRGRISKNGPVLFPDEKHPRPLNVLSPEGLSLLKRAEDLILNDPDYKKFCLYDPGNRDCSNRVSTCAPILSITSHPLIYGKTNANRLCGRKTIATAVSKNDFLLFIGTLFRTNDHGENILRSRLGFLLGKDFNQSYTGTWLMQSRIRIGFPFSGFKQDETPEKQEKVYNAWAVRIGKKLKTLSSPTMDLYLFSIKFANSGFQSIALRDMSLSIAAIVLVFLVMWIHTSSGFLAITAMAQVFLSFPLAYAVYRLVFKQNYFAALHILAIFLLLGIGADDVFVFSDAWKQSLIILGKDCDLTTRMSWTYRRAVKAMTVTSLTTAAAFLVTAASPIMPMSTLGIWAALLVIIQYLLVITVYPCAIIIWERFWSKRLFVRCFRKPLPGQELESTRPLWQRLIPRKCRPSLNEWDEGYRLIERFFRGPWIKFVYTFRFFLIFLAVANVTVSVYFAIKLKPLTTVEEFLPKKHPMNKARRALSDGFPNSKISQLLRVRLTWGIKGVDRTGTSKFEPEKLGKFISDTEFDFRKEEVQQRLLQACSFFGKEKKLLFVAPDINPIDCWIKYYKDWRKQVLKKNDFETYKSGKDQVEELIRFGTHNDSKKATPYFKYLRDQKVAFSKDKNRVVFTELVFISNVNANSPFNIMSRTYDQWQELVKRFNRGSPTGSNKMIATGGFPWAWQVTQKNLVSSMFTGIGIMLGVSFVVLSLATMNWAIAALTSLIIGGVVSTLLGVIHLIGWELGTTETVSVVIAVGYSFDGAAHIATAYIESKSETRFDRTKDALTDLGISILFGAITTVLAGFMLFPAIITSFVKFATLLVVTMISSMIWALLFFPAVLLLIGPKGSFGSLYPLFIALISCMSKRTVSSKGEEKNKPESKFSETSDEGKPHPTSVASSVRQSNVEGQTDDKNIQVEKSEPSGT